MHSLESIIYKMYIVVVLKDRLVRAKTLTNLNNVYQTCVPST